MSKGNRVLTRNKEENQISLLSAFSYKKITRFLLKSNIFIEIAGLFSNKILIFDILFFVVLILLFLAHIYYNYIKF